MGNVINSCHIKYDPMLPIVVVLLCTTCDDYYQLYHTASMARHIYLRPGAGVGAMQKIYGGEQLL